MKPNQHRSVAKFVLGGLLVVGVVAASDKALKKTKDAGSVRQQFGTALTVLRQQVEVGSEEAARNYYTSTVAVETGFTFKDPLERTKVADLLAYFKYPELTAVDLHALSSTELMAKGAPGEILATRFFAPKITDVTNNLVAPPVPRGGFGWRKLVRIKARSGSVAETKGIDAMWFLQNITDEDVNADPFDPKRKVSNFNQVILTRKEKPTGTQKGGWFLTFSRLVKANGTVPVLEQGKFVEEGNLNFGLDATFDEDNRDPETNSPPKTYFVPAACAQCHASASKPKINYLDTDHWFDRVTPKYGIDPSEGAHFQQDDFTGLAASSHGVVYDGGKDRTTPQFKQAFNVIRTLNTEIKDQNTNAAGQPFQRKAVEKWLQLHATNDEHIPPYKRGFGDAPWQEDKLEHRKLIYYLDRYCYRCHSSVRYHVMDRAGVRDVLDTMPDRLKERANAKFWMPQDRIFPGLQPNPADPPEGQKLPGIPTGQLQDFLKLLDGLSQEP